MARRAATTPSYKLRLWAAAITLAAGMLTFEEMPFLPTSLDAQEQSYTGKITEVASNGDLIFANGRRVRLQGIDLPGTGRCFAKERQRYMEEQYLGKTATYAIEKNDLMGKELVYVNASGDLGADLISSGYGFALLSFKYEKQDRYIQAQEFAKANRRGLWARCEVDCDPRGCKTSMSVFGCGG